MGFSVTIKNGDVIQCLKIVPGMAVAAHKIICRLLYLIVVMLFGVAGAFAQTTRTFYVRQANGQPVSDAQVLAHGVRDSSAAQYYVTDSGGAFVLTAIGASVLLEITAPGFKKYHQQVSTVTPGIIVL